MTRFLPDGASSSNIVEASIAARDVMRAAPRGDESIVA
jgi:hypothetical protein